MYYSSGDSYIASWNTQEANAGNGDHTIFFKAIDKSGNQKIISANLTVFNEGDVTYPSLKLILPEEEIYNSRVKIQIETEDLRDSKSGIYGRSGTLESHGFRRRKYFWKLLDTIY
ncbi:MAG: hypothetical protein CM15mP42_13010 [Methanobacteriota archaeon]|nr:MAG: hypothetical protein CM15mP42_13010 [Euryarchaeota archaeon]